MADLDDAEHEALILLRSVALDGHDSPPIEIACSRYRWTDPRDGAESVGVSLFDLPASSEGTCYRWTRHPKRPERHPAILLRGESPGRARLLAIAHELAHIHEEQRGLTLTVDRERWANRMGVAMLAPDYAVRRAWRAAGDHLGRLQRHLPHLLPTAALLRVGELGLASIVVYQGGRRRYSEGLSLPANDVARLVRFALRDGKAEGDGMRAYRLPDGPQRVGVLRAA